MNANMRDEGILRHILNWCVQIDEAHNQYNHSQQVFAENSAYRNAVSMCVFQICELANHLSDDFRNNHPELPWHQIRGMRNLFAHDYGNMDVVSIWETACRDIPVIAVFCKEHIGQVTVTSEQRIHDGIGGVV